MSDSGSDNEDNDRALMLAMLEAQCSQATGISISPQEELEDSSEQDEIEEEEEEEWSGIQGDKGEPAAAAVVFYDGSSGQSTSRRTLEDIALAGERDSFMSSKIRTAKPDQSNSASSSRKGKGRLRDGEDAEEEAHLASLDASLLTLIKDLPSDSASGGGYKSSSISSLLPTLSSLPNPRYTVRKDVEAPIDPRAPRQLREGLYIARLGRAKARHELEKEAGIVSAGSGGYALTKKKRREQRGDEDERRKKAKGLGGVVGKMRKGGAVLTLSKEEVRRGNEGDFEGLTKRKRKGPPKGLGGSNKKRQ